MKNDLPYFSHDNNARNHPKMKALRVQFGAAGYGQFWILNEMISQAAGARLDLSRRINKGAAANELGMTFDQFDAFLAFLSDPEIDLVNLEDGILTTDRTQEDFERVMPEREKSRERTAKWRGVKSTPVQSESTPVQSESTPRTFNRVEESRVEESREIREEKSARSSERPFLEDPEPEPKTEDPDPWEPDPPPKQARFRKPSLEEVRAYCRERGNFIDAQAFLDFYESKGWLVGKSPMRSWQAAIRTWESREAAKPQGGALGLRPDAWTEDDFERHRQEESEAMNADPDELEETRRAKLAGTPLGKMLEAMV